VKSTRGDNYEKLSQGIMVRDPNKKSVYQYYTTGGNSNSRKRSKRRTKSGVRPSFFGSHSLMSAVRDPPLLDLTLTQPLPSSRERDNE